MRGYEYILFDLDGTLIDPKVGQTKSVAHALKQFGINETHLDNLNKFIGAPLKESFAIYYGFDSSKIQIAINKYQEYFIEKGIFEAEVYDGINELLIKLKNEGKK